MQMHGRKKLSLIETHEKDLEAVSAFAE